LIVLAESWVNRGRRRAGAPNFQVARRCVTPRDARRAILAGKSAARHRAPEMPIAPCLAARRGVRSVRGTARPPSAALSASRVCARVAAAEKLPTQAVELAELLRTLARDSVVEINAYDHELTLHRRIAMEIEAQGRLPDGAARLAEVDARDAAVRWEGVSAFALADRRYIEAPQITAPSKTLR